MDDRIDTAEFAVIGTLYKNGDAVNGVMKTTWNGQYLIDDPALTELLMKSRRCDQLEKSSSYMMKLIKSGVLDQGGQGSPERNIDALKKQLQEAREEIRSLKLENQKLAEAKREPAQSQKGLPPAGYNRYLSRLSAESRRRKKQQAAAISLSLAICGKAPFGIAAVLSDRVLEVLPHISPDCSQRWMTAIRSGLEMRCMPTRRSLKE